MDSWAQRMPHQVNLFLTARYRAQASLSFVQQITKLLELLDEAGPSFAATAAALATTVDGYAISEPLDPYLLAGFGVPFNIGPLLRAAIMEEAAAAGISNPVGCEAQYLLFALEQLKRKWKTLFPPSKPEDRVILYEGPLYQAQEHLMQLLREMEAITDEANDKCVDICRDSYRLVSKAIWDCNQMQFLLLIGYDDPEILQRVRRRDGFNASKALPHAQEAVNKLHQVMILMHDSVICNHFLKQWAAWDKALLASGQSAPKLGKPERNGGAAPPPPQEIDESETMRRFFAANVLVSGLNRLGTEIAKNITLAGVSSITIHDMKNVDILDLADNCFLSEGDIGKNKAAACVVKLQKLNKEVLISALSDEITMDELTKFQALVFTDIDLDKSEEVDNYCHRHKPLICFMQSENYGALRVPPEKPDQCLTWACSEFEGLFQKVPAEVNLFLSNPIQYAEAMRKAGDTEARELLERMAECLDPERDRCLTFYECITWARLRFEYYFSHSLKQLTFDYPEDAVTSSGALFWSAPRRFPRALQFECGDPSHLSFILSASKLRANEFGIAVPDWVKDSSKLAIVVKKIKVPKFRMKTSNTSIDDGTAINTLLAKLHLYLMWLPEGFQMRPIQYEKNEDTNCAMDFVAGLASLCSGNYGIPVVDKLKTTFVAVAIRPAIRARQTF